MRQVNESTELIDGAGSRRTADIQGDCVYDSYSGPNCSLTLGPSRVQPEGG